MKRSDLNALWRRVRVSHLLPAERRRIAFQWWTAVVTGGDGWPSDNLWAISFEVLGRALEALGFDRRDRDNDEAVDEAIELIVGGAFDEHIPADPAERRVHQPREIVDDDLGALRYEVVGGTGGIVIVFIYGAEEGQRPKVLADMRAILVDVVRGVYEARGKA